MDFAHRIKGNLGDLRFVKRVTKCIDGVLWRRRERVDGGGAIVGVAQTFLLHFAELG